MHRKLLVIGAIFGALSVGLGAFAAHALRNLVSDIALGTFETGVRYQFYHTIAIFIAAFAYREYRVSLVSIAGWLFVIGILLFSGSLYMLAFIQASVKPGYNWIGAVTPVGGLLFIIGWLMLAFAFMRNKRG